MLVETKCNQIPGLNIQIRAAIVPPQNTLQDFIFSTYLVLSSIYIYIYLLKYLYLLKYIYIKNGLVLEKKHMRPRIRVLGALAASILTIVHTGLKVGHFGFVSQDHQHKVFGFCNLCSRLLNSHGEVTIGQNICAGTITDPGWTSEELCRSRYLALASLVFKNFGSRTER